MGMFDRIWVTCPECGKQFEQQSKAGICHLEDYYIPGEVPCCILDDLAGRDPDDIEGYNMRCDHCKCVVELNVKPPLTMVVGVHKKKDDDGDS